MELKTTEIEGVLYAVVQDGMPVYVDGGKDTPVDAGGMKATISRLNGEAQGHREAKEKAETALKVFEGLDPEAARKAIETVSSLDQKKLIDAGEKDAAIEAAINATREEYAPIVQERDALQASLHQEMVGGSFARSKFVAEDLVIPSDLVEARFGKQFKIEDNSVVGYDSSGNVIYSKTSPGEKAGFEEALSMMVEAYPQKDHILKGANKPGSGAPGGSGEGGDNKTIDRAAFDALQPAERMQHMKTGGKVVDAA